MSDSQDRREALKIIGAISVSCAFPFSADELYAQHVHTPALAQVQPAAAPYQPTFFTDAEYKLVRRIADLIIPPTDTPGASAAGVPEYIDRVVQANAQQQKLFRAGLEWIERAAGGNFASLTEERQIELLTPLCAAADAGKLVHTGDRFFLSMKNLTADGYYTSQAGLVRDLGYSGNSVLPEFPSCSHSEHKS